MKYNIRKYILAGITAILAAAVLTACGGSKPEKDDTVQSTQEIFAMDTYMSLTAYGSNSEEAYLQERIDKIAVRAGLPNRHHGGSGRCGRGQRREHDGKAQFQMQHAVDEDEHRDRGQTGFQHGDDDHLRAVSPEHLHLEKLARAERDERQRHVRKKIRSVDDGMRNHIQAARPHQNARQNIARHIGQAEPLGDSRHCETGEQHGRNRNNDPRHRRGLHGFDQFSPFSFPI